jgi:hypothetical protein
MADDRQQASNLGPDWHRYARVLERMGVKADRDGRALWIGRALGCSSTTMATLDALADRSHTAWKRAARALTASDGPAVAEPSVVRTGAHRASTSEEPTLSSPDGPPRPWQRLFDPKVDE